MYELPSNQGFDPVWLFWGGILTLLVTFVSTLTRKVLYFLPKQELKLIYRSDDPKLYRWTLAMWYLTGSLLVCGALLLLLRNTNSKLAWLSFLATPPYVLLILGLFWLLSGIAANLTGETLTRFHKYVYRTDDSKEFWKLVVTHYLCGAALVGYAFYLLRQ